MAEALAGSAAPVQEGQNLMDIDNALRHVCTKQQPWDIEKHGDRGNHPDVVCVGLRIRETPGGATATYKCKWCGLTFRAVVPK